LNHPRVLEACLYNSNCMPPSMNGRLGLSETLIKRALDGKLRPFLSVPIDRLAAYWRNELFHEIMEQRTLRLFVIELTRLRAKMSALFGRFCDRIT
jgi:hypothetical protein